MASQRQDRVKLLPDPPGSSTLPVLQIGSRGGRSSSGDIPVTKGGLGYMARVYGEHNIMVVILWWQYRQYGQYRPPMSLYYWCIIS